VQPSATTTPLGSHFPRGLAGALVHFLAPKVVGTAVMPFGALGGSVGALAQTHYPKQIAAILSCTVR